MSADLANRFVGRYENHAHDQDGKKNDRHFITLAKRDERTLQWTNRAGNAWTLTVTDRGDKLRLGTPGDPNPSFIGAVSDGDFILGLLRDGEMYDRVIDTTALLGAYENHAHDADHNKDGRHYVSIKRVDDTTLTWSNRAGRSWRLTTTANPAILAVSAPEYPDRGTTTIVREGDYVSGLVWGGELYRRVTDLAPIIGCYGGEAADGITISRIDDTTLKWQASGGASTTLAATDARARLAIAANGKDPKFVTVVWQGGYVSALERDGVRYRRVVSAAAIVGTYRSRGVGAMVSIARADGGVLRWHDPAGRTWMLTTTEAREVLSVDAPDDRVHDTARVQWDGEVAVGLEWAGTAYDRVFNFDQLAGTFKCRGHDTDGHKNDRHYVSISRLDGTRFRWSNRAAQNWLLTTTPTPGRVAVECQHYPDKRTAEILWEDDTVSAVIYPTENPREIYLRDIAAKPLPPDQSRKLPQRYDLLRSSKPLPQRAAPKYVRDVAQPLGGATLNGRTRPVRRVTITGLDLVLEAKDSYGLLRKYDRQEDIQELYLVADSITIDTALRLPQTDVTIVARTLRFTRAGSIDTTPITAQWRNPLITDGEDGAPGGDIRLLIGALHLPDGAPLPHLRSCGAMGQDPDEGGFETSTDRNDLKPITKEEWDKVFAYDNRQLVHEMGSDPGMVFYYATFEYPSWEQYAQKFPDRIVYVEISNQYYANAFHTVTSDVKIVASAGRKVTPGSGGAAKLPGKPGVGGAGGNITINRARRALAAGRCDVAGGSSGRPLPRVPGAAGGTPSPAVWLLWQGRVAGSTHPISVDIQEHAATLGATSPPGPAARSPSGEAGCLAQPDGLAEGWVVPVLLNLVIQFARDCIASDDPDTARASLAPYVTALAANSTLYSDIETLLYAPMGLAPDCLGDAMALRQLQQEAAALMERADAVLDEFGNPPGWVPSLSLESAVSLYNRVLQTSLEQIFAAYCLQKAWQRKTDKSAAIERLLKLLAQQTEDAQQAMLEARKQVLPAVNELNELVRQMEKLAGELGAHEEKLRREADYLTKSEEQKAAIAAAFKIGGAILKALPLPPPYQLATGAAGSLFDITADFIDKGGNDAAFDNLKKQVGDFVDDKDLADKLSHDIGGDIKRNNRETTAIEAEANSLKDAHASAEARDAALIAQAEAEHVLAGKLQDAQAARLVVLKEGKSSEIAYLAERDKAIAEMKLELLNKKRDHAELTKDLDRGKTVVSERKKTLERRKAERADTIKTRIQQIKNITDGIVTIGQTINKLTVFGSQINSVYDAALAKLQKTDSTFLSLMSEVKYLDTRKIDVTQRLARLTTQISTNQQLVVKNLTVMAELTAQKANSAGVLDPAALAYVQSLDQDAHRDLRRFLYYVVKAFEYYMVRPWEHSYASAQKLFEDLRNLHEPSGYRFDFDADPHGEKQKELQALLQESDSRPNGELREAEFKLLALVYQKPLWDMGKTLADQLMKGAGRLVATAKTVTLAAPDLQELNRRITGTAEANAIRFNLLKLRQIDATHERQRIQNIKVVSVRGDCTPAGFPDQTIFKFTLDGKSIVRADNVLYAFDPETDSAAGGLKRPGISFETTGGKVGGKGGWNISGTAGVLQGKSLQQPDTAPQENLLSTLMMQDNVDPASNSPLVAISQFRPGLFSDFTLSVEFLPTQCTVRFTEIVLEITLEMGNGGIGAVFVSIDNNLDLPIAIAANVADECGRTGAPGHYVGFYDAGRKNLTERNPIRFEVPATFGGYRHTGWLRDGKDIGRRERHIDVAKSTYLTATYEPVPDAAD